MAVLDCYELELQYLGFILVDIHCSSYKWLTTHSNSKSVLASTDDYIRINPATVHKIVFDLTTRGRNKMKQKSGFHANIAGLLASYASLN